MEKYTVAEDVISYERLERKWTGEKDFNVSELES